MNGPASGSTEGGRNNGLNIRGERLLAHTVCVACVTRGTSLSFSLSLSLSRSHSHSHSHSYFHSHSPSPRCFIFLFFLTPLWRRLVVERADSREREREREREHTVWMEEQCTPYINIVPITRSPGGYRSWKTPTNFGRRTNHATPRRAAPQCVALSPSLDSPLRLRFFLGCILLRSPKPNEKARTRSDRPSFPPDSPP